MADIILQFQKKRKAVSSIPAEIDVKATADDFDTSGLSLNITSYARIRTAYVDDPDYIFIILSLKHKVCSKRSAVSRMIEGLMEVVKYNAYDLKKFSAADISYNLALGTGQLQIRNNHYVTIEPRTSWGFCRLLDRNYLASSRRSYEQWHKLAVRFGWARTEENASRTVQDDEEAM